MALAEEFSLVLAAGISACPVEHCRCFDVTYSTVPGNTCQCWPFCERQKKRLRYRVGSAGRRHYCMDAPDFVQRRYLRARELARCVEGRASGFSDHFVKLDISFYHSLCTVDEGTKLPLVVGGRIRIGCLVDPIPRRKSAADTDATFADLLVCRSLKSVTFSNKCPFCYLGAFNKCVPNRHFGITDGFVNRAN